MDLEFLHCENRGISWIFSVEASLCSNIGKIRQPDALSPSSQGSQRKSNAKREYMGPIGTLALTHMHIELFCTKNKCH